MKNFEKWNKCYGGNYNPTKIFCDTQDFLYSLNFISSVAHELESHISSFASRVEQRRRLLELSVLFYSHTEEVNKSFDFDSKSFLREFLCEHVFHENEILMNISFVISIKSQTCILWIWMKYIIPSIVWMNFKLDEYS